MDSFRKIIIGLFFIVLWSVPLFFGQANLMLYISLGLLGIFTLCIFAYMVGEFLMMIHKEIKQAFLSKGILKK